ncbi:divalent-cation tolerance protein CutA [Wenzhouxiangella sp. C33]|uniref:Divalent-cation tolerance protein CutA n=1 Tax=Wenzhouxiangella limi TaxID=2707351 RepID=A0A845V144_9GAMM|nr:divalent-cation tolerance protein CutA [Wenzhouxiangella limi]NDY95930.1 divalent-cation tolerance protein CutA [Wenzhouxiangella limi]
MSSCRLLLAVTTCADASAAERLAAALVEARLAACVSISAPVRSVYPWQGRIEVEQEVVLTIKTAPARIEALKRFIAEHHDYDVPELLISPVTDGAEAYLQWAENWMTNG